MKLNAIIPARGGSKGIPRKNIIQVCGKPLIVWTIEQALAAECIGKVIVSTDDDMIAEVALRAGAIVWRRSAETATDTADTESAVQEVLRGMEATAETVLLQCTSPIRQPGDIDGAIRALRDGGYDSIFSARRVEGYTWEASPIGWHRQPGPRLPRQMRTETTWEENGSIYAFNTATFQLANNRLCGVCVPYKMHVLDSFQIDEPADIPIIELMMRVRLSDACDGIRAA